LSGWSRTANFASDDRTPDPRSETRVTDALRSEEVARRAFAEARPALRRALGRLAERKGPVDAEALLTGLEQSFVGSGRFTYTGTASVRGWLAATLARILVPARAGCPDVETLAWAMEKGSPLPHLGDCADCRAAAAAVQAASSEPAAEASWDKETRAGPPPPGKSGRTKALARGAASSRSRVASVRRRPKSTPPWLWVIAAGGIAAAALGVNAFRPGTPPEAREDAPPPVGTAPLVTLAPALPEPRAAETKRVGPRDRAEVREPDSTAPDASVENPPAPSEEPRERAPSERPPGEPRPPSEPGDAKPQASPPPGDAAATSSTSQARASSLKLEWVSGNFHLRSESGSDRALAAGPLEVKPEDRLSGDGSINLDGKRMLLVDQGTIGARLEDERPVVRIDRGFALVDGSGLLVETPEGSVSPEGRLSVRVDAKEVGLSVALGRAIVHTRTKEVPLAKGEGAVLKNGTATKHRPTPKEVERVRALARRPVLVLCAGAKEKPYTIEQGTVVAANAPCGLGQAFGFATDGDGKQLLTLSYTEETAPRIPIRGTVQFQLHETPASTPNRASGTNVWLELDGPCAHTNVLIYPAPGRDWQTVSLPVSALARSARESPASARLRRVNVLAPQMTGPGAQIDHITFNADDEAGRFDCDETVLATFREASGPQKKIGPVSAGPGLSFALRAGRAEGDVFFSDEQGAIELVPVESFTLDPPLVTGGGLALRYATHSTAKATLDIALEDKAGTGWVTYAAAHREIPAVGPWSFFETYLDTNTFTPPQHIEVKRISFKLAGAGEAAGFKLTDLELVCYRRR
jgi:hypothetical protein